MISQPLTCVCLILVHCSLSAQTQVTIWVKEIKYVNFQSNGNSVCPASQLIMTICCTRHTWLHNRRRSWDTAENSRLLRCVEKNAVFINSSVFGDFRCVVHTDVGCSALVGVVRRHQVARVFFRPLWWTWQFGRSHKFRWSTGHMSQSTRNVDVLQGLRVSFWWRAISIWIHEKIRYDIRWVRRRTRARLFLSPW